MKKQEKVWLIGFIILAGFFFAVAYAYFRGSYLHHPFPKNTFLCMPIDVGNDFFHLFRAVRAHDPYGYEWSLYFPFTYIPLFALSIFSPLTAYCILFALFFFTAVRLVASHLSFLSRYERWAATFTFCFLSYPMIFILDRGNLEVLLFMSLALFFVNYERSNLKWSVFFLACAAAMKLYPLVFAVLFLRRKQYKHFAATLLTMALLTAGSAAFYPSGVMGSLKNIASKLGNFREAYVIGDGGLPYTASYFNVIKVVSEKFYPLSADQLRHLLPFYSVAALGVFGIVSLYVMFREKTFWKQVALLTFMMILLPQVTVDYKLIHLLFPVMFFIIAPENQSRDRVYALLFALLLIPKNFYWIHYKDTLQDIPISNVFNPFLMTIMIGLIMAEGLMRKGTPLAPNDELSVARV